MTIEGADVGRKLLGLLTPLLLVLALGLPGPEPIVCICKTIALELHITPEGPLPAGVPLWEGDFDD